jgi:hypothetical protein
MDPTVFFFWCPLDIIFSLYAFVFQDEHNCPDKIQGYHSYTYCSKPDYIARNPHVFLRRICSVGNQIDVLEVGRQKFKAYYRVLLDMWTYVRIIDPHDPDIEMGCGEVEILGLARVKEGALFLVKERGAVYLTDSVISTASRCIITIPDSFVSCSGILVDADKLVHIEGKLPNGLSGVFTYCPKPYWQRF